MSALKSTFLSLLLLTVPFGVKGNTTTVTLFDVEPASDVGKFGTIMTKASAIGLDPNGGTVYLEEIAVTSAELVFPGTPSVTTTATKNLPPFNQTVIQAASWVYASSPDPSGKFNNFEVNCTLTNSTTGECIEILQVKQVNGTSTSMVTQTTTYNGQVVPLYTLTGPIPTSTTASAATILGNPTFNRLLSMMFFVVLLVFGF